MDFPTFKRKLHQVAVTAQTMGTTAAEWESINPSILDVTAYIAPGCDVGRIMADREVLTQLAELAMVYLEVAAANSRSMEAEVVKVMRRLATALSSAVAMKMETGRMPTLPQGEKGAMHYLSG